MPTTIPGAETKTVTAIRAAILEIDRLRAQLADTQQLLADVRADRDAMLCALQRVLPILECRYINDAGTLDLVRAAIARGEG